MTDVYFIPMKERPHFLEKTEEAANALGIKDIAGGGLSAVKLHFGEMGNTAYIKPIYINHLCSIIEKNSGKPFLTDANTLYRGQRSNSVNHIRNALFNGFSQYPIIIADGLRGESYKTVHIEGKLLKEVYVAADIHYADSIVCVSHFKGHELSGFGGAIKNLGMGCGSKRGKLQMHSNVHPYISDSCLGCMNCASWCNENAIDKREEKAFIDESKCIGCGLCIEVCVNGSIRINWDAGSEGMQRKMTEYALGTHKNKHSLYINHVMDITPACDCYPYSGNPVAPDIGIMISSDPVAVDFASYEKINEVAGERIFERTHAEINPLIQIEHGESIGLGSTSYSLIEI